MTRRRWGHVLPIPLRALALLLPTLLACPAPASAATQDPHPTGVAKSDAGRDRHSPAPGHSAPGHSAAGQASAPVNRPAAQTDAGKAAPQPRLTFELQPADLTLDDRKPRTGRMLFVAHNLTNTPVASADLELEPPGGISAEATEQPAKGPQQGDLVWLIRVTADETAPAAGKLVARLNYVMTGSGAREAIGVAVASITVPPAPDLTSTVKAELAPAEASLDEFNPARATVQFTNTARRPVAIGPLTLVNPHYVRLQCGKANDPAPGQVKPGETVLVPLTLCTAHDGILPGTYDLVLSYRINDPADPGAQDVATVQGKVTIGVPGISDAMQLLGIPSLLLFPGILTALSFAVALPPLTRSKPLDWKTPPLLLLAIALSFFYAFAYPYVTGWLLPQPRNYLRGYDLYDVIWLWTGSIGLGLVLAALAAAAYWLFVLARWAQHRRLQPAETDTPDLIVQKLLRRRADFRLPRLRRRPQDGHPADPATFLPLPFDTGDPLKRWVVRQGIARETDLRGANRYRLSVDAALGTAAEAPAATRQLWRAVRQGRNKHALEFVWTDGANGGPQQVADADYFAVGGKDALLRCEP